MLISPITFIEIHAKSFVDISDSNRYTAARGQSSGVPSTVSGPLIEPFLSCLYPNSDMLHESVCCEPKDPARWVLFSRNRATCSLYFPNGMEKLSPSHYKSWTTGLNYQSHHSWPPAPYAHGIRRPPTALLLFFSQDFPRTSDFIITHLTTTPNKIWNL